MDANATLQAIRDCTSMKGIDFFNTMEYLEPRCPKCETKIEWGVNTEWSEKLETQVCKLCGTVLK